MSTPSIETFANRLHHGDCLSVMQTMPSASVDLIVTDPPYLGYVRDTCKNRSQCA